MSTIRDVQGAPWKGEIWVLDMHRRKERRHLTQSDSSR
jgi:hypothetical protein